MLKVFSRRLVGAIPVLLVLALVVFILQKLAPVDPAVALVGEKAPAEVLERAREQLGLNDPVPTQYVNLSLIHISEPRDGLLSRMPSSA